MHKGQVYPAEPYRPGQLMSLGKADGMLLRQFQFPDNFEERDLLVSRSSDRLDEASPGYRQCLTERVGGFQDGEIERWVRKMPDHEVLELIAALLATYIGECKAVWTGYRVTASILGNGQTNFQFELFAKHPETATRVYTGEDAPNVLPGPRHDES